MSVELPEENEMVKLSTRGWRNATETRDRLAIRYRGGLDVVGYLDQSQAIKRSYEYDPFCSGCYNLLSDWLLSPVAGTTCMIRFTAIGFMTCITTLWSGADDLSR
ncbi:hypothetical protein [Vreelandella jeotgali]|uniref:hypothetical protein n=1 Tax=Vreelandella jeotgali TaxID=553386 RepID=UPI0012EA6149|nr:hypothetical protein [Halomonas jeotgali]